MVENEEGLQKKIMEWKPSMETKGLKANNAKIKLTYGGTKR